MSARQTITLNPALVTKLHARAGAVRWGLSLARFTEALVAGATGSIDQGAAPEELEDYLSRLHLEDLALACACADGHEAAWDEFVRQHRPALYRAADALEPGGAARDLADGLFGELFGLGDAGRPRKSLLLYFHGRSSLTTWLRAVLAQRHVDAVRSRRRLAPLPEAEPADGTAAASADHDRHKYLMLMRAALASALAQLSDRDRLRLSLYYVQQLKLAQVGRVLNEHEATVSRQLARSRAAIHDHVTHHLRSAGLGDDDVRQCLESVTEDAGPLDLGVLFAEAESRKFGASDRSI